MTKHMRLPKLRAPPRLLNVRNYKKSDLNSFRQDMNNVPFDKIKSISKDANEMWILWKAFFLDILHKHAPIVNRKVKGNNIPYVTSELNSMIRHRDYLRAKTSKTGPCILRQAYNQIKTKVSQKFYSSRKNYHTNKIQQHKDDMKSTWKILKHAIGRTHKTVGIDKVSMEGIEITDKNRLLKDVHFVSIGQKLASDIANIDANSPTAQMKPVKTKFSFKPISVPQVIRIIKKLLNSKATGIHGIPNKTLKETADIIGPSLTDIFNFSVLTKVSIS